MSRLQYSAFAGDLNRNRRQELLLTIEALVGRESARILAVPICANDARQAWKLDQYPAADGTVRGAGDGPVLPRLRIIGADNDD